MSALKRTHIEASNKARKDLDHIHHHLKVNNYRYYRLFSMRVLPNLVKKTLIFVFCTWIVFNKRCRKHTNKMLHLIEKIIRQSHSK